MKEKIIFLYVNNLVLLTKNKNKKDAINFIMTHDEGKLVCWRVIVKNDEILYVYTRRDDEWKIFPPEHASTRREKYIPIHARAYTYIHLQGPIHIVVLHYPRAYTHTHTCGIYT